jgi:hypothetical protein
MIFRWMKTLRRAAKRFCRARGDAQLTRLLTDRNATIERLRLQEIQVSEDVKRLQSINRIQQAEIDELSTVVARNLERVKAETRVLAGGVRIGVPRGGDDETRHDA